VQIRIIGGLLSYHKSGEYDMGLGHCNLRSKEQLRQQLFSLRRGQNVSLRGLVVSPAGYGLLNKLLFFEGNSKKCLSLSLEPSPWLSKLEEDDIQTKSASVECHDHVRA
jgi:hypothetical protein